MKFKVYSLRFKKDSKRFLIRIIRNSLSFPKFIKTNLPTNNQKEWQLQRHIRTYYETKTYLDRIIADNCNL